MEREVNTPPTPWFDDDYEEQLLKDAADRLWLDPTCEDDSRRAFAALTRGAVLDPFKAKVLAEQAPWVGFAIPLRVVVTADTMTAECADPPSVVADYFRRILQAPQRLEWLVEEAQRWLDLYRREHKRQQRQHLEVADAHR